MSLQGSVHKWSDGIGYGAFIPTDRAYYNVCTPTASARGKRRPSSETIRDYRRHNVTAGIDTHRSDISFGRTTDSVRGGVVGESRAREATKSLTSGEVGGFVWSAGRRREGNIETMAASSPNCRGGPPVGGVSTTTSITSSAQSARDLNEQTAQAQVVEELRKQRDSTNQSANSARSCTSSNSSGGGSTWRSGATSSSASMPSSASYNTSRLSSARSSCSSNADGITENQCRTRRSTTPPTTRSVQSSENDANSSSGNNTGRQRSHRSTNETTPRETRLGSVSRATPGAHGRLQHTARRRNPAIPPASPATARQLSQFKTLDPVFQPHHKYDLIAQERAARGGEVTGRFGPVDGSSVLAASLLTSELSTPWSHVLRGQKW